MRAALIAGALVLAGTRVAAATPRQELEQARNEFRANDFASAIPLLKDLIYPQPRLARTDEIAEVHILLGSCELEVGRREDARAEFEQALTMEPDAQVDTLLYSPTVVKLFNEVKAEVDARAKADAANKLAADRLASIQHYRDSMVVYEVHPYYVNFVPFGAGQFQNKDRDWGIWFAASEGTAFAGSAGIWLYLVGEYGFGGRVPLADASNVRRLEGVEIVSGGAFFALAAWGIVDSLVNYEYRARVQGDDSLLPPDLRALPAPKTSLRDRLHFGPLVLPSGLGLGLALED